MAADPRLRAERKRLDQAIEQQLARHQADPEDLAEADALAALHRRRAAAAETEGARGLAVESLRALAALAEEQAWPERLLESCERLAALGVEPPCGPDGLAALRKRVWSVRFGRLALALASAVLLVLAAPPHDLWPLALVALAPLYLAIRRAPPAQAAVVGWLCGFATNLAGFRWAYSLLDHFGHVSASSRIAILIVVCAYQASVFALWAGGASLLARRARIPWLVSAPLWMVVVESAIPFLFPWNLAITVWRAWPLLQVAELGGPQAVSALLVLINLVLVELATARRRSRATPRPVRIAALVAVAVIGAGLLRAGYLAKVEHAALHVRVGLVQPNAGIVGEEERKRHGEQYLAALRSATAELGRRGAELVVWPESAFPYLFDRRLAREYAAGHPWELRPGYQGTLLFGALTHDFGTSFVYNSAVLVTPTGRIAGIYDKNQLLAFGEYVPFADRFPDWAKRVRGRLPDSPEIEPGDAPKVLTDGALRIGPLICYEDIFPGAVYALARMHPNLLVTLANHAWFGASAAPREALALATLRSVETRRALVRATNTGVSSMSDALGRLRQVGPLLDVPRDHPAPPTLLVDDLPLVDAFALGPYTAPLFPYVCAVALFAVGFVQRRRGARSGSRTRTPFGTRS